MHIESTDYTKSFRISIPGQYLIGEVSGKPLVKNAANLGRAVIEHMLATGLTPGALGRGTTDLPQVDVAIVGSGPGGLSAALSCIQRGLSYVVLEKEQMIASTILRYPKGKLVMAEPYDTENLSLLPVFDSSKEQLVPIWQELLQRVNMKVAMGESVESVVKQDDGTFLVRSTVNNYRAQRVVLSIGTRGKPRTLGVTGENLPKVYSLLEDPDAWRGKSVLVVGGGDSAVEAALALADAGALVIISYRGKAFSRCAPKNKQAIEAYGAEGRLKVKLQSQILAFEADTVTMALGDGTQKRYSNDAAFVLIGADPPVAWLEKLGVMFVERDHQYQLGKSDDVVRRLAPRAMACPEDAQRAAAVVLGGNLAAVASGADLGRAVAAAREGGQESGARKWIRSATSIFSGGRAKTDGPFSAPQKTESKIKKPEKKVEKEGRDGRKLDGPVPLSEFARQQRTGNSANSGHTGHGRRDALSAGERTRILRMLRDEGGRIADEDSSVYIGAAPAPSVDFDLDDSPAPAPLPKAKPKPLAGATSRGAKGPNTRSMQAARNPFDELSRAQPSDPTSMINVTQDPQLQARREQELARQEQESAKAKYKPVAVSHAAKPLPPPNASISGQRSPQSGQRAPLPAPGVGSVLPPTFGDAGGPPDATALGRRPKPPTAAPQRVVAAPSESTVFGERPRLPGVSQQEPDRTKRPTAAGASSRKPVPAPFAAEQAKRVDPSLLAAVRSAAPSMPDEATRMANIDSLDEFSQEGPTTYDPRLAGGHAHFGANHRGGGPSTEPNRVPDASGFSSEEDRTSIADPAAVARRTKHIPAGAEERTRIGEAPPRRGGSNVDWDLE